MTGAKVLCFRLSVRAYMFECVSSSVRLSIYLCISRMNGNTFIWNWSPLITSKYGWNWWRGFKGQGRTVVTAKSRECFWAGEGISTKPYTNISYSLAMNWLGSEGHEFRGQGHRRQFFNRFRCVNYLSFCNFGQNEVERSNVKVAIEPTMVSTTASHRVLSSLPVCKWIRK